MSQLPKVTRLEHGRPVYTVWFQSHPVSYTKKNPKRETYPSEKINMY